MPVYNSIAAIPNEDGEGFQDFRNSLVAQGPILPVHVGVPDALAARLQAAGEPIPSPVFGTALVDTGAGVSGIDVSVVEALKLQPVGQVEICGVTGTKVRSQYPAKFTFAGINLPPMNFEELVEAEIANQKIPGAPGPLIALIGRDILHHFVLIYNGPDGTFTLAC